MKVSPRDRGLLMSDAGPRCTESSCSTDWREQGAEEERATSRSGASWSRPCSASPLTRAQRGRALAARSGPPVAAHPSPALARPAASTRSSPVARARSSRAMKNENCRNSDCQFSMTAAPKWEETRYRLHVIVGSSWAWSSSLYSRCPATDCPRSEARKRTRKKRERELSRAQRTSVVRDPDDAVEDETRDDDDQVDDEHRPHAGRVRSASASSPAPRAALVAGRGERFETGQEPRRHLRRFGCGVPARPAPRSARAPSPPGRLTRCALARLRPRAPASRHALRAPARRGRPSASRFRAPRRRAPARGPRSCGAFPPPPAAPARRQPAGG